MRDNRPYGSEGGVGESRSLPLSRWELLVPQTFRQSDAASSICLKMQPAIALERGPDYVPVEAGLPRDVAQRQHHALLQRLQPADIEIGVGIRQERRKIGRACPHEILNVALGLAGRAAEGEVDVDEVLRQIAERAEIGKLLPGPGAEKQHQLPALELARLAQPP